MKFYKIYLCIKLGLASTILFAQTPQVYEYQVSKVSNADPTDARLNEIAIIYLVKFNDTLFEWVNCNDIDDECSLEWDNGGYVLHDTALYFRYFLTEKSEKMDSVIKFSLNKNTVLEYYDEDMLPILSIRGNSRRLSDTTIVLGGDIFNCYVFEVSDECEKDMRNPGHLTYYFYDKVSMNLVMQSFHYFWSNYDCLEVGSDLIKFIRVVDEIPENLLKYFSEIKNLDEY